MYHDIAETEVIELFQQAGGELTISPTYYWEPLLPTKRLKNAFARLIQSGVIRRGQSSGGMGRRSYITYHLR